MKKLLPLLSFSFVITSCVPGPEKLLPKELFGTNPPVENILLQTPALEKNTLSCEEASFVTLLNLYRKQNKLGALSVSESGVESARWHAQDMSDKNYFSHTEPDGRTFSERALSFGYPAWSENISAGYSDTLMTFCQWKNSSAHNSNMLRADHKSIGIGKYSGNGTYKYYWENTFGPEMQDYLTEPLTKDANCILPKALPSC